MFFILNIIPNDLKTAPMVFFTETHLYGLFTPENRFIVSFRFKCAFLTSITP